MDAEKLKIEIDQTVADCLNQGRDFAEFIASGDLPLRPSAAGRFHLIPLASAAIERVDTLHRLSIQTQDEKLERLTKAAEKVYQMRTEAPGGERFVEFYNALLQLGHALNINNGWLPRDEDRR